MYQKIFVPIDSSQTAQHALQEACQFAKETGSTLYIAHVVDWIQLGWGGTGCAQSEEVRKIAEEKGMEVLQQALKFTQDCNVNAEPVLLHCMGEKIDTLLSESVKQNHCDLVIMGTHGFTGMMHLLMGSVAEGVLRQVQVPIMLVRRNDKI